MATLDTNRKIFKLLNNSKNKDILDLLYEEIINFRKENNEDSKVLISLDVPLGWPERFGSTLSNHTAGMNVPVSKNDFFTRFTDNFCSSELELDRNTILDVAADKIAKTSYTVLEIIDKLKNKLNTNNVSVVWDPCEKYDIGIIEVYPRTWITQTILSSLRYKSSHSGNSIEKKKNRMRIVRFIDKLYPILNVNSQGTNEHRVDALICCLIGDCFNRNLCCSPPNGKHEVRKEGWIWFPLFFNNTNKLSRRELSLISLPNKKGIA